MTSAHALTTTRDCKVAGCPWDAEDARGRYAGLCRDHKRAVIAVTARRASARPADGRIIAAAQAVLAASRKLEGSLVAVYKAEQRRNEATLALRASIGELIATTHRELGDR